MNQQDPIATVFYIKSCTCLQLGQKPYRLLNKMIGTNKSDDARGNYLYFLSLNIFSKSKQD